MASFAEPTFLPLDRGWSLRDRLDLPPARLVQKGHVLVREGAAPTVVHLIERGLVTVGAGATNGHRATLALLGPGDVAGWPRTEPGRDLVLPEARALTQASVVPVVVERLTALAARDRRVEAWLAERTERALLDAWWRLSVTLTLPLRGRLLELLRWVAAVHGRSLDDDERVTPPLTQEDLAELAGATRETVNRALTELRREGLVRRSRGGYAVRVTEPARTPATLRAAGPCPRPRA